MFPLKPALLLILAFMVVSCRNEQRQPDAAAVPSSKEEIGKRSDPHSYARPEEARVEHISLDLTADFAKKQLTGSATLRIRQQPGAKVLMLDSKALDVRRVTLEPGSIVAQFKLAPSDPILGQALEIPLRPETTSVVIEYATSPEAHALQWLEPPMTAGKKHPFLLSQSQAINARSWVPCQDSPGVRFTYEATLRVPKELLAVMSAENPQEKSADGVYRFSMPNPIPSYLLAVAIGDLEFHPFDSRSGVYAEPPVIGAAAEEFSDTPEMIEAAETLYGPYRWGRYDLLVLPPSFPYGGMENPRLTFLTPTIIARDRSLVALVAHELAHSWSGNLVTNAIWNDFWLNEGFTTYIEHRLIEKLYGREYAEMLWSLGVTELKAGLAPLPAADQSLALDFTGRNPDEMPSTVYEKGALFLRLLEETAGRERWDQFLRTYFEKFAFQPMTTAAFEAHLKSALPDVAQKVNLAAWIHGPGIPPNVPQPRSAAFTKVEAQAKAFAEGATAESLQTEGWSSHERVHFIESLPKLAPERMQALERRFRFSESGNSEVLSAWLEKSLDAGYRDAHPAIERFLTTQGRRKFLRPLYEKLSKTDPELARRIYAKARPTYHPVSQATIDEIMKAAGPQ